MDREAMAEVGLNEARKGIAVAIQRKLARQSCWDHAVDIAVDRIVTGLAGNWREENQPWERWAFYQGFYAAREAMRYARRRRKHRHRWAVALLESDEILGFIQAFEWEEEESIDFMLSKGIKARDREILKRWAYGERLVDIAKAVDMSATNVANRMRFALDHLRQTLPRQMA
jgi:DNA-directed RNA polymerase specialized sigma24 family protein